MNIAVVNLKDITKYIIKTSITIFIMYITVKTLSKSGQSIKQITEETSTQFLTKVLKISIPLLNNFMQFKVVGSTKILFG